MKHLYSIQTYKYSRIASSTSKD